MTKKPSVFLLLGPEAGEKSDYLDGMRSALEKRTGERPEETRFYAFETAAAEVVAYLRNGSLFSTHRIAIVESVELYKKKEEVETLAAYCATPSDEATLFLVSEQTRLEPRLEKAVPADQKKIFWEMFENQKVGWLTNYLRKKSVTITNEAAELLLELVENNTLELRRECDRLALFFGSDHAITPEDVETYVFHSREENVFSLFEAVSELDFPRTLEILQSMMLGEESNAVGILAGLMWQFRNLHALKILLAERVPLSEAFQRVKIRAKKAQRNYQTAERNFSEEALERIIVLGNSYDARFRNVGSSIHPLLLQMFLYSVVIRGGKTVETELREKGEYEL